MTSKRKYKNKSSVFSFNDMLSSLEPSAFDMSDMMNELVKTSKKKYKRNKLSKKRKSPNRSISDIKNKKLELIREIRDLVDADIDIVHKIQVGINFINQLKELSTIIDTSMIEERIESGEFFTNYSDYDEKNLAELYNYVQYTF